MKENYSVLLIGQFYDNHNIRFVRSLKRENPKVQIDCFSPSLVEEEIPADYLECYRNYEIVDFSSYFRYVPILKRIEIIHNWHKYFRSFSQGKHYDIVNIHYPRSAYYYILPEIRKMTDNLVLSPWGSDVYRINNKQRKQLQKIYNAADYVTGRGDRFTKDFMTIFHIPQDKFVFAGMGSETIDYIVEHKNEIDTNEAKRRLGIEDYYTISCGYNATPAQQHLKIVEAISHIKEQLPQKLILLFPVTYPKNIEYLSQVKKAVEENDIQAIFYDKYLDLETLFVVRQATDMFIHVQTTDANNASLKEYLLCEKNCINGAWLKYPDVESHNYKPYHSVSSIDSLDAAILKAFSEGAPEIKDSVLECIRSMGCKSAAKVRNEFFMSISK